MVREDGAKTMSTEAGVRIDLPVESSSESKTLPRLSLFPSMNSNPQEERNSSTSWSSSNDVVIVVVAAEFGLFIENWMASLISGSSELIASPTLSRGSL